uniref:Uncharacterized protein n=1 Tax=Tetranychus urticae TaxID=32264 RepID=T1JXI2_TETUR
MFKLILYLIPSVIGVNCLSIDTLCIKCLNDSNPVSSSKLSGNQFKPIDVNQRKVDSVAVKSDTLDKLDSIVVKAKHDNREWTPKWSPEKPVKVIKVTAEPVKDGQVKDGVKIVKAKEKKDANSNDKSLISPGISFHELESTPVNRPTGLYTGRPVEFKTLDPWESANRKSKKVKDESLAYLIRAKYMPIHWRFWMHKGRPFRLRKPWLVSYNSRNLKSLLFHQFSQPTGQWKFGHLFGSGLDAFWPTFYH